MGRVSGCAAALLLVLFFSSTSHGQILDRSDTQEWNEVQVAIPLNKNIDFNLGGILRLGRHVGRPVDERIGAGFSFKFGKYLTVAPNYLHIGTQPFKGRKVFENRLSLPLTFRFALGKFRFSDRNLFERRLRHPGGDSTRYRQKFLVEHPLGRDSMKLSVIIGDEIYYDWSINVWPRNRFQAGISKVLNKQLTLEVYYLRQNDSHSVPGDLNVLGTLLRIRL